MDCKERLEGYLKENGVAFDVQEHRPAFTAQRVAAAAHVPGRMFAKVVMAQEGGELVMLVLPATEVVDTRKAEAAVGGEPLRLATEREFASRFPNCEAGAMPPFGNLYDLPVFVDEGLAGSDRIVFQAGTHTVTMSVPYVDFERLARPTVTDFAVAR